MTRERKGGGIRYDWEGENIPEKVISKSILKNIFQNY